MSAVNRCQNLVASALKDLAPIAPWAVMHYSLGYFTKLFICCN